MNNTNIQTNTAFTVLTGVYTPEVIAAASSVLQGCYKDYYFFQYAANDYVLLVGDISFSELSCTGNEVTVYEFFTSPVSSAQTVTIPFSGSQSGQYGGSDGAGGFSGSVTGNSTIQIQTDTRYNVSYSYLENVESVTIINSQSLVYGSDLNLPHLIEGVENYAFTAFALAFGVICFKLFDRFARRVY